LRPLRLPLLAATAAVVAAVLAPGAVAGSPVVYADSTGDSKSAPDVVQLSITDNGNGTIAVSIKIAAANLGSDGLLGFFVDADRNRSTGSSTGADYLLVAASQGAMLGKWNGSDFAGFAHQPINPRFDGTELSFTLTLGDLGTTTFDFVAVGLRGNDVDVAPDNGGTFPPQTPPQAATPEIKSIAFPATLLFPKAGRVYRVNVSQIAVRLTDDEMVRPESVTCTLTYRGKALKPLAGGCAWKLPKKLKKAKLVLTIAVSYQGQTGSIRIPVTVR
jgi:hypothetical protein